jgi:general secretion pathway protein B
MSYILEALKKSEQEREREKGHIPDLKSVHGHTPIRLDDRRAPVLRYVIAVISLAGLSLLLYFAYLEFGSESSTNAQLNDTGEITRRDTGENNTPPLSSPKLASTAAPTSVTPDGSDRYSSSQAASTDSGAMNPARQNNTSTAAKFSQPHPNTVTTAQVKEPTSEKKGGVVIYEKNFLSAKAAGKVVPISELPDEILRKLPSLTFSGHVYSSVVAKRSIVINGKKMREGDSVNADLLLHAVTPSGAVFNYKGVQFKLSALQDWSYK